MQKKICRTVSCLLCVLMCLGTALPALSEDAEAWNRACRIKTAGVTNVYALSDSACTGEPVAQIPAGTYCKSVGSGDGIWLISYLDTTGKKSSGFALQRDFVPAVVSYVNAAGERAVMQELKWQDLFGSIPENGDAGDEPVVVPGEEAAAVQQQPSTALQGTPKVVDTGYLFDAGGIVTLYRYGFAQIGGQVESGCPVQITDFEEQGYVFVLYDGGSGWVQRSVITGEKPEGADVEYDPDADDGDAAVQSAVPSSEQGGAVREEREISEVPSGLGITVVQLGAYTSIIRTDEGTAEVLTMSLLDGGDSGEEASLAVIHAPKTGKATLREKGNAQAKILQECAAGKMLVVTQIGDEFSKVSYDGREGYIRNGALRFVGVLRTEPETVQISKNGNTSGKDKINIRNMPDRDSAVVALWATGTRVTVITKLKGWYEIEYDGIRGYIIESFVTP